MKDPRGGAESAENVGTIPGARSLDEITGAVVDAAVKIHQALGPGLLESVYIAVLARALVRRGLEVERQKVVRFEYDGIRFDEGLRVDLFVDDRVIVELKSVEKLAPVHGKQVLSLNFGGATLKEGLQRIVNNLDPSASPVLRVNQRAQGSLGPATSSAPSAPSVSPRDPWS